MSTAGGGLRIVPGNLRTRRVRALSAGFSGRAAESRPGAGLSFAGILRGVRSTVTDLLTGGPTAAAFGIGSRILGGAGSTGCPGGFRKNPITGVCEERGFVGAVQRVLPGGQLGTIADTGGSAVVGAFGLPARVPAQVGSITRNDGSVGPLLRCIAGMVLGKDNLCYPTQVLSPRSKFRKHKRPRRAVVTPGDSTAIARAARAKERVKSLAKDVGFTVSTKGRGSSKSTKGGGVDIDTLKIMLALNSK